MIKKIVLTNFKRHKALSLDFTQGMVALRGANEAGKSTTYHAILYAMFGAKALPLTLAETVTYDMPESSLKVHLEFDFEGKTVTITRSKSGAVLHYGDVTANGQAEVTRFVEALFKVNADAATKIMIASQNGLRGALETGDAVPLIEKLANINLIDELIAKVQDQLPCGNTKQLVEALATLEDLKAPVLNLEDLKPAVGFHAAALALAESLESVYAKERSEVDEEGARAVIAKYVATKQHIEQASKSLEQNLARTATPPAKPAADISALKTLQALQTAEVQKYAAYVLWSQHPKPGATVSKEKAANRLAAAKVELKDCQTRLRQLSAEVAGATASLITDKECGLCGKDLTTVEEVVKKNADLQGKIATAKAETMSVLLKEKSLTEEIRVFAEDHETNRDTVELAKRLSQYVELTDDFPCSMVWQGPAPAELVQVDYSTQIRQAETDEIAYQRALAVQAEVTANVGRLQAELKGLMLDTEGYDKAQETLSELAAKTYLLQQQVGKVGNCRLAVKDAEQAVALAQRQYDTELTAYRAAMVNKANLQTSLEAYQKNNALIKKLREARPIVASRLWAIVLASVSQHFSQIRGVPSTVTRNASTFLVDGRNVMGVSGSTLDSLGLAIRVALGKTFLPSVQFLLLDEPSAGMDQERETAMLGLLATLDYGQVIVVTHSELADAFATSVVQV